MNNKLEGKLATCRLSVESSLDYTMNGLIDTSRGRIFTIHTRNHSLNIENNLKSIISICNIQSSDKCAFNEEEEFILYCSAWLHDLGCVLSRENHAKHSRKIIMENPDIIHGIDEYRQLIADVSGVHSYNENIEDDPIKHLTASVRTKENNIVKLQYLSAVFRLADACDMDTRKAPKLVYKLLSNFMAPDSLKFWEGHTTVYSCHILENEIEITFTENSQKSKFVFKYLEEQFNNVKPWLKEYDFPIISLKDTYIEDEENWKKYLDEQP